MANLAAANYYKKEHLLENWKTVETAEIYYISVRKTGLFVQEYNQLFFFALIFVFSIITFYFRGFFSLFHQSQLC